MTSLFQGFQFLISRIQGACHFPKDFYFLQFMLKRLFTGLATTRLLQCSLIESLQLTVGESIFLINTLLRNPN